MFERLVAGVLVIGALLWGASILASPDRDEPPVVGDEGPQESALPVETAPDPVPPVRTPDEPDDEDDRDDEDDDDRGEGRGKKKKGRGG